MDEKVEEVEEENRADRRSKWDRKEINEELR